MAGAKGVVVTRFEKPPEFMFPVRPKHEIQNGCNSWCVPYQTAFSCVYPFWTDAGHELRFPGKRPRFLEEKVRIPFCGVTAKQGCDTGLQLQPISYRRDLNCRVPAKTRPTATETLGSSPTQLDNCDFLLSLSRLRQGRSRAEQKRDYKGHLNRAHAYLSLSCGRVMSHFSASGANC